jgi:6-phospho-beta-glucosidase
MKITVIGGGSTYTPELIKGFLDLHDQLPLDELWLMDIQPQRLEIVGDFCERIVEHSGAPFKVRLTDNRREALQGADYVITQLRVGFIPARREDEYLGRRHGLVGQETTGIGGMAKALRTIPVILEIAKDMRALAPGAMMVNFTNPSGLVTEALFRHAPEVPAVGLCNSPITTKMEMLEGLRQQTGETFTPARASLDALGLNHLCWYRGLKIDDQDVWPQILQGYVEALARDETPEWPPELIRHLGMIPNSYIQYYYHTSAKLAAQAKWPPSRAEQVLAIEADLLREYAEPQRVTPPPDLMKRGGAYYSTLATQVINAHFNNLGQVEVVNVRHAGAVPGWPVDWVLELPCRIDRAGIHPLPTRPLPLACFGLLAQVKSYELLTVEAAVRGSRAAAYQAMLTHPLGPEAPRVQAVLEDMLQTHRRYLPRFFEERG